jgi:hypothetical protein
MIAMLFLKPFLKLQLRLPLTALFLLFIGLISQSPVLAHGGKMLDENQNAIFAAASFSYRSNGTVEKDENWRIPGVMMGGEAYPVEQGAVLDDAFIQANYEFYPSYEVKAKIASHGGGDHSEVEFEHFWLEKHLASDSGSSDWQAVFAAGKMAGSFTPSANWHSSLATFSEAPLNADVFFGRFYNDTGIRATASLAGFSLGVEVFNGDAFPATAGEGSADLFLHYQLNTDNAWFKTGIWAMQSKAEERGDERFSAEHSHGSGSSAATPLDARFTGTNDLQGAFIDTAVTFAENWQLSFFAEGILQQSTGTVDILDNGRSAEVDLDYAGWQVESALAFKAHQLALRYERLATENHIKASSPAFVADDANLLSRDFTPERFAVSYRWHFNPMLTLRSEYIVDDSTENSNNRFVVGFVWQNRLWQQ